MITVTMLGASKSGKTTYMHGMYAILAAGLRGYFMYTEDPDKSVDLLDAWDLLYDTGQLPVATTEEEHRQYEFVFKHGLTPLLTLDWWDYRGGAIDSKGGAPDSDVRILRSRLDVSDSIYLVLDGGKVGEWLADPHRRPPSRDMKLSHMSAYVSSTVDHRRQQGLPVPSIVVLITKADVLGEITGGTVGSALIEAVRRIDELLPVACAEGVTALICPVQIGKFGLGNEYGQVDVADIDPVGLHRPLIFSLRHYLTETMTAKHAEHSRLTHGREETNAELERLRSGFLSSIFRVGRISELDGRLPGFDREIGENREETAIMADSITQLSDELAGQPILRDGELIHER